MQRGDRHALFFLAFLVVLLLVVLSCERVKADESNPYLAEITNHANQTFQRPQTLSDLRRAEADALDALHVASAIDWAYTENDSRGPRYICGATWTYSGPHGNYNCAWGEGDPLWARVYGTRFSFPAFAAIQVGLHYTGMALCSKSASTCRLTLSLTGGGILLEAYFGAKGASIHHAQVTEPYYGSSPLGAITP